MTISPRTLSKYSFSNSIDSRYQFEVEITNIDSSIRQIGTPPGNPIIYYVGVFGARVSSKTNWKSRLDNKINFLTNADPSTEKFKKSVCWTY